MFPRAFLKRYARGQTSANKKADGKGQAKQFFSTISAAKGSL